MCIFYEEPEEVDQWKEKLIPKAFDVQQILYPTDHTQKRRGGSDR